MKEDLVGLREITASQEYIVGDQDNEWLDNRSKLEVEFDEQQHSYKQELTNLRVLEWLNEMTSNPKKTLVTIQSVDRESMKYISNDKHDHSWAAQEGPLIIPASNLNLLSDMRSTDFFLSGELRK